MKLITCAASAALTVLSVNAAAAILAHVGTVTQVATETRTNSDGTPLLGGCYARLSTPSPHQQCTEFVNFACMGSTAQVPNVGSKSENKINFDAVQLAYVAGKTVRLSVDDSVIINGSCYARGAVVSD